MKQFIFIFISFALFQSVNASNGGGKIMNPKPYYSLINIEKPTCTVEVSASVGFGGTTYSVKCTATAEKCEVASAAAGACADAYVAKKTKELTAAASNAGNWLTNWWDGLFD